MKGKKEREMFISEVDCQWISLLTKNVSIGVRQRPRQCHRRPDGQVDGQVLQNANTINAIDLFTSRIC